MRREGIFGLWMAPRRHKEALLQAALCPHPCHHRSQKGDTPGPHPQHFLACRAMVCWSPGPGRRVTCVVGFLQEHAVLLGPEGSLGAMRLAQQDGGGLCRPVPVGRVLRYLPARQVLHGFGGVGGDSEMEKGSWGFAPGHLVAFMAARTTDTGGRRGLGQVWPHLSLRPPLCSVDWLSPGRRAGVSWPQEHS